MATLPTRKDPPEKVRRKNNHIIEFLKANDIKPAPLHPYLKKIKEKPDGDKTD